MNHHPWDDQSEAGLQRPTSSPVAAAASIPTQPGSPLQRQMPRKNCISQNALCLGPLRMQNAVILAASGRSKGAGLEELGGGRIGQGEMDGRASPLSAGDNRRLSLLASFVLCSIGDAGAQHAKARQHRQESFKNYKSQLATCLYSKQRRM